MRRSRNRYLALVAAGALVLAACGDDNDTTADDPAVDDQAAPADPDADPDPEAGPDADGEDPFEQPELEDPNEDVVDGVYRGSGVVLPVPDGWELDPNAFAQGVIAAISEDGTQQLSAQAIDATEAEAAGQSLDLDELLENVRQLGEAEVDEEVELEGATRAQRLTFLDLPAQQEGAPESSATVILAEDDRGYIGEFAVGAASEDYDESLESLLLDGAGFDPDSEPPEPAMPAPMPEGDMGDMGDLTEEDLEQLLEDMEGELGDQEPDADDAG